jgi:hypothetical protein
MPANPLAENSSSQPAATRRHFPLSLVLPLGQLLLCAVLIVIFCGPESLMSVKTTTGTGTIYVETQSTVTDRSGDGPATHVHIHAQQPPNGHVTATGRVLVSVWLLNLPGSILKMKLAAYGSTHQGFVARAVDAFTGSWLSGAVLALPLWWIVGRGADALLALKRKAIHPRIRFAEAAISFLLLMAGALFTVIGIYAALSSSGSWALVVATLLWSFLGGLSVRAWQMQRRNGLAAN